MKYTARYLLLLAIMSVGVGAIVWRMFDLNILERSFLLKQGDVRVRRVVNIPAHRGMITDRAGKPLAISAQVSSVWVNPKIFKPTNAQLAQVANLLQMRKDKLNEILEHAKNRNFFYLKRGVSPELGRQLKDLDIAGLFLQAEFKRFYPESEVTAHIVGFTNIDDLGQEGVELAYDDSLRGTPGKKEVVKDRVGNIIAELNSISQPQEGHNLALSIDSRIQYLAYSALKDTVTQYRAKAGSIVVLDVENGEILAMVNFPSYNPNHIVHSGDGRFRNRAVTDQFEPGSTIKAFSMAAILESGKFKPTDIVHTSPGWINIEGNTIKDVVNHGDLTVLGVLQKSSNVGFAKLVNQIEPDQLWKIFHSVGFGQSTYSGFPGEVPGTLMHKLKWRPINLASLAMGYGVAVTTLQLTHAFSIIANNGVSHPVSFIKLDRVGLGERILPEGVCKTITTMLESVTQRGGTGRRASVAGFRVAGKTGTAYIAGAKGYDKEHYMSSFVGFAPVSKPKLVIAVVVQDPKKEHFGGLVAAPAFAKVMSGGLRLLAIAPDNL